MTERSRDIDVLFPRVGIFLLLVTVPYMIYLLSMKSIASCYLELSAVLSLSYPLYCCIKGKIEKRYIPHFVTIAYILTFLVSLFSITYAASPESKDIILLSPIVISLILLAFKSKSHALVIFELAMSLPIISIISAFLFFVI